MAADRGSRGGLWKTIFKRVSIRSFLFRNPETFRALLLSSMEHNRISFASCTSYMCLSVENIATIVSNIAEASVNQASSVGQVNAGITQIADVVQTNSATSEQCAAASAELSSLAGQLQNAVRTILCILHKFICSVCIVCIYFCTICNLLDWNCNFFNRTRLLCCTLCQRVTCTSNFICTRCHSGSSISDCR